MKNIAACSIICSLLLCLPCRLSAEMIDKIIAILDHDLILLSEIREQTAKPATLIIANIADSAQRERDALPYLVERRLLEREIQSLAYPKDNERMEELALTYLALTYRHGTADELRVKLKDAGISRASVEDELVLYMKGMDYIRRKHRFSADIDSSSVVMELFRTWVKELNASIKLQIIP